MTPIVEMRGITRAFAGVRALDGASFTLQRGEAQAIQGDKLPKGTR